MNEASKLNFSQRNGLEPVPEQLKLGQVSKEFRSSIEYAFQNMIDRITRNGADFGYINKKIMKDFHINFFGWPLDKYKNKSYHWKIVFQRYIMVEKFNKLFDLIEFFMIHPECDKELKSELEQAFIDGRVAYRLKNNLVIAVGTHEQAKAVLQAIDDAGKISNSGARQHLVDAGKKLADGDWKGSVLNSIHSVEAIAKKLASSSSSSSASSLGKALNELESKKNINPALKRAFGSLYGYASDTSIGVRHANVLGEEDLVDDADALFMLGACASFVSYLIAKYESRET